MNFEWSTNDIATMTVTIYETNLTLSYGRISNKSFVLDLSEEFGLDFSKQQCYKLKATYDIVHGMMIIQL